MNIEIERKYLVTNREWITYANSKEVIQQGYLSNSSSPIVRVRTIDDIGYLTVKDKSVGLVRNEFEYKIPVSDALELLKLCNDKILRKIRYTVQIRNTTWEIDEFLQENKGLTIAEVELDSINSIIDVPKWIGKEVTNQKEYYNKSLVEKPYTTW